MKKLFGKRAFFFSPLRFFIRYSTINSSWLVDAHLLGIGFTKEGGRKWFLFYIYRHDKETDLTIFGIHIKKENIG